jgi:beta-lactamase superfamily II metal-dependent hydrolase
MSRCTAWSRDWRSGATPSRGVACVLVCLWTLPLWGCGDKNAAPALPTSPTSIQATVSSVSVTASTTVVAVGQSIQLTATALLSNGSTQNCTASATWSSTDTSVARVSSTGLVSGVAEGTVEIRATCQGVQGAATVRIDPVVSAGRPLEIHYLDVGQGDAAILIAPNGESVMFDNGPSNCGQVVAYLRQQGLTKLDYHIASHYHADHIGCSTAVFSALPPTIGLDRGGSYTTATYANYVTAVSRARQTAVPGSVITLDQASGMPVTIQIVAVDSGISDENDRSIVAVVHYAGFDAEFGGDITDSVEGAVASRVGRVEAYKVHHHGSQYSSSTGWLAATSPRIGVISVGNGNSYGHPARDCLDRLHSFGVQTFWTEAGAGVAPDARWDVVSGTAVIEMYAGSGTFSLRWGSGSETFALW